MPGRPFLMIPGPTLVPERIVRAMSQPIIDHRGPRFAALVEACLEGLKGVFKTRNGHVILYPGSGTGAWEAALVNTLSPGDRRRGRAPPADGLGPPAPRRAPRPQRDLDRRHVERRRRARRAEPRDASGTPARGRR